MVKILYIILLWHIELQQIFLIGIHTLWISQNQKHG